MRFISLHDHKFAQGGLMGKSFWSVWAPEGVLWFNVEVSDLGIAQNSKASLMKLIPVDLINVLKVDF